MKHLVWPLLLVAVAAQPAVAQPAAPPPAGPFDAATLAHTRRVIDRAADRARTQRIGAGIAGLLGGCLVGGLGIALASADDQGGIVDLSPIVRGFGYVFIAEGAILVLTAPIAFVGTRPEERIAARLAAGTAAGQAQQATRRARAEIADHAERSASARRLMRGIGLGLLGAGAVTITATLLVRPASDRTALVAYGGGSIALLTGGSLVGASAIRGPFEASHAELQAGPLAGSARSIRPVVAPTWGGVLVGLQGAF